MTSFEDKILASVKIRAGGINASRFISNLRAKQVYESNRKKRIRTGFSAFAFIFLISIITFNQLENFDNYNSYVSFAYDESEIYFEILGDQLNESSINDNDLTLFYMEESNDYDLEILFYMDDYLDVFDKNGETL
ncbi:MAG: hypothetical protein CBC40_01345 [bacterium TMED80]|jgi:hypothetical protein|nr:MAG: hypothetical protein CBC40_01345 [bacterium TMED80]RZP23802.1 MAG: hypothetical protein EVA24_04620 [bacterium]|tara:strand:+ start:1322 stop:1726 length:405 start_codon:yes stop_codon:yes gene_type:complete